MQNLSQRMLDTLDFVWADTPNIMSIHANTLSALRARDFVEFVKIDGHIHVAITKYGRQAFEWACHANLAAYKECLAKTKVAKASEKLLQ